MLDLFEDIVEGIFSVMILTVIFAFLASPLILIGWAVWAIAN